MDKLKAFVAAGVAFASYVVLAKFKFEVPVGLQELVVAGILSLVSGGLTWLVPNKTA